VVTEPQLVVVDAEEPVWRVGFKPEPWAWSGWEWAGSDGRFDGRWDDSQGNFRTVYAGSTLLACLLEVLAGFRPDPTLAAGLDSIVEDDEDAAIHSTATAGEISYSWLGPRLAASATLTGRLCAVTAAESIAALLGPFVALAHLLGLHDFDAAALKDARARALTQSVATHLHATTELEGVTFASRHGDDLALWAVFERAGDSAISHTLDAFEHHPLSPEDPALQVSASSFPTHGRVSHPTPRAPESDTGVAGAGWSRRTPDSSSPRTLRYETRRRRSGPYGKTPTSRSAPAGSSAIRAGRTSATVTPS